MAQSLLQVRDLKVYFPVRTGGVLFGEYTALKAVDGISFDLKSGETLGVVGESGCGKSTLGRAVLQLVPVTAGAVSWLGSDLTQQDKAEIKKCRQELQIVFQDPLASLDPRMTAGDIIAEPLRNYFPQMSSDERKAKVQDIMAKVGLLPAMVNRYPHEFSGGQCQRIGIARAMILRPKLIVCDEPVSALDVSIRAQVINLLMDLQKTFNLSLIFISHDLAVVRHISHRVMVMYLGRVMELAERESLYRTPRHPYTQALLAAVPIPDPDKERAKKRLILTGDPPSPLSPPSGCVFRTRCGKADDTCTSATPVLDAASSGHEVACHHWRNI
ncbi:MAG: dipeptide ABC transporter ATP-binding protein [Alphaproteobacteria bacterium]|jgi:oligopeptide transport system ATP-binding protein|nr:dipeptide ABC transporter ATP-binding protein [Alphaproteobacteria bacterium]PHY01535.1 MAG: oligopeptide ABC transporter ATP-binding protein OppF [Rhodospirillaceae bacterium]